ncbi:hypothetical protein HNY73_009946, partial [Argiope bruennichi]
MSEDDEPPKRICLDEQEMQIEADDESDICNICFQKEGHSCSKPRVELLHTENKRQTLWKACLENEGRRGLCGRAARAFKHIKCTNTALPVSNQLKELIAICVQEKEETQGQTLLGRRATQRRERANRDL